jgi:predicted metal-dependent hydrolase
MEDRMAGTSAPESVEVVRRDIRFDLDTADLRSWHPEGLHVAHFFNALSVFFPEGEKFFIDSVRHYRERIDSPALMRDVKGFVGQEAMHSREHRRYNAALERLGLPIAELDARVKTYLDQVRGRTTPEEQLAVTIALEHFTAIMAHTLLSDERLLTGAEPHLAAIWRWHAVEETEHKAVAYDVYRLVAGEGTRAWVRRSIIMLLVTLDFWQRVFRYHFRLVRADGAAGDLRGWWRLFRWLWLSPGGMRQLVRPWLSYFRRDFHPWQHDNSGHVERWKAAYAASGLAPA